MEHALKSNTKNRSYCQQPEKPRQDSKPGLEPDPSQRCPSAAASCRDELCMHEQKQELGRVYVDFLLCPFPSASDFLPLTASPPALLELTALWKFGTNGSR